MNSRQRFLATLTFNAVDHPPLFEEGLREGVLENWRRQGLPASSSLDQLFQYDSRVEVEPDLESPVDLLKLASKVDGLAQWESGLAQHLHASFPEEWNEIQRQGNTRSQTVILRLHEGFFLTLGIGDWRTFAERLYLVADHPAFIARAMAIQSEANARYAEKMLQQASVEAILVSEPIAGQHGALISPRLYRNTVLSSYRPILEVAEQYQIPIRIWRSYANPIQLLPAVIEAGFNCLWAVETNPQAMDFRQIRREFGRDLRLIGGIDTDSLRQDRYTIQQELEEKIPPLLEGGGYIPLADGRIREDVPWQNYVYYRRLLEKLAGAYPG